MANKRSPNYPNYDLPGALILVDKIFTKDGRNKVSRLSVATHLGHDSLSGPALGKIGALRAYGLIEGVGDELRVSENAIAALKAPAGSADQMAALSQLSMNPALFQMIKKQYPKTLPSKETLTFWLLQQDFSETAARIAAGSYLNTMAHVVGLGHSYNSDAQADGEGDMQPNESAGTGRANPPLPPPKPGTQRAEFPLAEGVARVEFPSDMSSDSYEDLAEWLKLVLRRAKRSVKENDA